LVPDGPASKYFRKFSNEKQSLERALIFIARALFAMTRVCLLF
jgi:hypothetical protein